MMLEKHFKTIVYNLGEGRTYYRTLMGYKGPMIYILKQIDGCIYWIHPNGYREVARLFPHVLKELRLS